ncbi:TPA: endonuclease domain-containing protein [Vibrio parahaemolyticus]|uniref:endonuclease domain-containing protein n=1 Tax=Vibrio parahaemolyticus TaxID=670 RepID=UPI0015DF39A3|nr:DUF559 domain-containing protein [Vibrio parahaemolyticus]
MTPEQLRIIIDDTENLPSIIEGLVDQYFEQSFSKSESDENVIDVMAFQSKTVMKNNVKIIEKMSESLIEKYFLHSFNISTLLCGLDLPVTFLEPHCSISSAELYIDSFRKDHKEKEDLYQSFKCQYPQYGGREFLKVLEESGKLTEQELMGFRVYIILYRDMMCNAVHFIPQAKLPDTKVDGKGIRVDGLLWIPSKPDFKVIVECDGYKYHGNKASFINDRKRDRVLKRNGYTVLRYSGSEIWSQPVESGIDLVEYLLECCE